MDYNEIVTNITKDQMINFVETFVKTSKSVGEAILTALKQTSDNDGFFIDPKQSESLAELLRFLRGSINALMWCYEHRREVPIKVENNTIKEVKHVSK